MQLIRQARQMAHTARALARKGKTIGFVPTMGALHEGHLSLIRAARRETQIVVVSIFVNPKQFGPGEDYERYPRDLKRDLNLAKAAGCDIVFAPHVSQVYPSGFRTHVEVEGLSEPLEGAARPGHFRGVATVVTKLCHVVQPTVAYFGQKDYQQAGLIQRLVKDLDLAIEIRCLPTVREPDGLAMSSRNTYLSQDERQEATVLSRALLDAKQRIHDGERDVHQLTKQMRQLITTSPLARVDYVAFVNAKTLEPLTELTGRVAILVAVWIGSTRLIDNILVDVS